MPNFVTPENSFIQFHAIGDEPAVSSCEDNIGPCLPVHQNTDIGFQVQIEYEEDEIKRDFVLALINDCTDEEWIPIPETGDSFLSVISPIVIDDLNDMGYLQEWFYMNYDLGSALTDKQCFKLGIFQVKPLYAWTFPQPNGSTYAVNLFIDGVDTVITASAVLSNVADVVTLLNNYFIALGNPDVVTTPASTVIQIFNASHNYGIITFTTGLTVAQYTPTVNEQYEILACSNCLYYVADTCFTLAVKYRNNEDAFGFTYSEATFYNEVRLPFYIDKPQTKAVENVFRYSDSTLKVLSATFEKEYEGHVGYLDEAMHTAFAIALKHDYLAFRKGVETEYKTYLQEGAYEVDWLNKPGTNINVAPAKCKVKLYPFLNVNSNCE